MVYSAACLCKKVTFELSGEPKGRVLCSCTHCQRASGSPFSLNLVFGKDDVKLTSTQKPKAYKDTGDSGNTMYRNFCPECGSAVYSVTADETYFVKGSTIGIENVEKIDMSIYTKNRPSWASKVESGAEFSGPPES